ncbi:MAG: amino acid carrier protein, partial [Lachnospiraceae bacterium]|nr:amino acid carrier protein [Lachnospiraceae bacterium]
LVIIGGVKRISSVAQVIVPFMALLYIVTVILILITHLGDIPTAVVEIIESAFGLRAAAGGTIGAIMVAMQKGIARGIFSNEAGLGSAPIAAATVKTDEPVAQGLVSMTATFIDTIIICTMTGLAIVITGTWDMGLEGVDVTNKAFQMGLPFPEEISSFILMVCLVFFAFTTILGWDYYSEKCVEYLVGDNQRILTGFRCLYILAIFIGPFMTVSAVWTIADIFNGLMAFPNLIALIALSGVVVAETKKYFEKKF